MYNTEATGSNTVSTTTTATATGGTIATATAIHTGKLGLFDLLHSYQLYGDYHQSFMTTDINKDGRKVKRLLNSLDRDNLKALFEELGLSETTLGNKYSDSAVAYLDDLVRSWIHERDDVLDRGGATWENLKSALQELGHNGIADII